MLHGNSSSLLLLRFCFPIFFAMFVLYILSTVKEHNFAVFLVDIIRFAFVVMGGWVAVGLFVGLLVVVNGNGNESTKYEINMPDVFM